MIHNQLVSIVMPIYNSEKYLEESIYSIINQTYANWELLAIDDASSDNSKVILKKLSNMDNRIKPYYMPQNLGAAYARNIGIESAVGRYLMFLDSDDIWEPNKIELQLAFMMKNKYAFTFTSYCLINKDGSSLHREVRAPIKLCYKDVLTRNSIWTCTVCLDLDIVSKPQMPLIKEAEDTATWLSILKTTDYAYGLNLQLASYRQVPGSLSHNIKERILRTWRLYRKIEKFNLIKSSYLYTKYIAFLLRKRKISN